MSFIIPITNDNIDEILNLLQLPLGHSLKTRNKYKSLMMMVSYNNYLQASKIHCLPLLLVVLVGPDQSVVHYNVTECLDESIWISLRLNGQTGTGRQCEVHESEDHGWNSRW